MELLKCPECGWVAPRDEWDSLWSAPGTLFCRGMCCCEVVPIPVVAEVAITAGQPSRYDTVIR